MKTTLLLLVAALSALTSFSSVAGRSGDQIILQELQNKRVAQEKQQTRAMMECCSAIMERCSAMMQQTN